MKPNKIIIVRHGQAQGNVDRTIYLKRPDYTTELTALGRQQAYEAGQKISDIVDTGDVCYYISPYWRTRQTYQQIAKTVNRYSRSTFIREDPRLKEQDWGGWRLDVDYDKIENERDAYGNFFYRLPNGESCEDVYGRMSDFLDTLHRDFEREDFPPNVVIVTHGMAMRCLIMRWFHYSVERFQEIANPHNAEFWVMQRNAKNKYDLVTPLRTYEKQLHPWQFDWDKEGEQHKDVPVGS